MKSLPVLALLLLCQIGFAQNILVADNNPGRPGGSHVYSTLQAAIDAASAGDIIHVIPSATNYDGSTTVNITKNDLSIYGLGFYPDKDGPQTASIYLLRISGSNIRISGLKFINEIYVGYNAGNFSGITIENCELPQITSSTSGTISVSNVLVRGCLFNRAATSSIANINFTNRVNQSVISNCIIIGYHGTTTTTYPTINATNGTIIKNSIFYGDGRLNKPSFGTLTNCTVSNCIFYGRPPTASTTLENNVFNNNVAVGTGDNTLPPTGTGGGNSGTGNFTSITDSSTIFTDPNIIIPANNGSWVWSYTWDPKVAHPSLTAGGTDGTAVGVEGSTIPYSPTGTSLPLIQKLIVPEVIKQGDNLNATIEAQGY